MLERIKEELPVGPQILRMVEIGENAVFLMMSPEGTYYVSCSFNPKAFKLPEPSEPLVIDVKFEEEGRETLETDFQLLENSLEIEPEGPPPLRVDKALEDDDPLKSRPVTHARNDQEAQEIFSAALRQAQGDLARFLDCVETLRPTRRKMPIESMEPNRVKEIGHNVAATIKRWLIEVISQLSSGKNRHKL